MILFFLVYIHDRLLYNIIIITNSAYLIAKFNRMEL